MRATARVVAATVLSGLLVAAGTAPAFALDPIGLSLDGTSFARELPEGLFAGARIVPASTIIRSFWVKNQQTTEGNLALAVQDVAGPGALISRLSIAVSTDDVVTSPVALGEADPCIPMFSAVPLPAGASIRITVSVSLADLDGAEAQGAVGDFALRVTLTSADVPSSDGCGSAPAPPVDPPATAGPGAAPGGTVVINGFGGGPVTPPQAGSGDGSGGGGGQPGSDPSDNTPRMNGNTDRLHQEYFVAAWLLAVLLGGLAAWARSRRHHEEDA